MSNPYESLREPLEAARKNLYEQCNVNLFESKEELVRAERAKKYIQQLDAMIQELSDAGAGNDKIKSY